MTITNGKSYKKLELYPLVQPLVQEYLPIWVEDEEEYNSIL